MTPFCAVLMVLSLLPAALFAQTAPSTPEFTVEVLPTRSSPDAGGPLLSLSLPDDGSVRVYLDGEPLTSNCVRLRLESFPTICSLRAIADDCAQNRREIYNQPLLIDGTHDFQLTAHLAAACSAEQSPAARKADSQQRCSIPCCPSGDQPCNDACHKRCCDALPGRLCELKTKRANLKAELQELSTDQLTREIEDLTHQKKLAANYIVELAKKRPTEKTEDDRTVSGWETAKSKLEMAIATRINQQERVRNYSDLDNANRAVVLNHLSKELDTDRKDLAHFQQLIENNRTLAESIKTIDNKLGKAIEEHETLATEIKRKQRQLREIEDKVSNLEGQIAVLGEVIEALSAVETDCGKDNK